MGCEPAGRQCPAVQFPHAMIELTGLWTRQDCNEYTDSAHSVSLVFVNLPQPQPSLTEFLSFASSPVFLPCSLLASQHGPLNAPHWPSSASMPLERQPPQMNPPARIPWLACTHKAFQELCYIIPQQAESFPIFLYLRQYFPHLLNCQQQASALLRPRFSLDLCLSSQG